MTPIGRDELWRKMQAGAPVTVVDVLSELEYETKHLPGAINLPWEREEDILPLADRLLPDKAAEIVVYCASQI